MLRKGSAMVVFLVSLRAWRAELLLRRSHSALKRDHFFATISTVSVIIPYAYIYYRFNPDGGLILEGVPPAGFIFALLLPLIWIIAALWAWLGRYRLALYVALALSFFLSCTDSR